MKEVTNNFSHISIYNYIKNNIEYIFCLLSALFVITICSKCSPLYPLNDWGDSNCFFTVGKSIFKGLVPYRDLYEQKGPYLYFIHAFASLISYKTFFGVYLCEIINAFYFFLYSCKTLEFFCGKKSYYVIPFIAFFVYTSSAFCHGDSSEEFCFPFLAYIIYITFKPLRTDYELKIKDFLIIGIVAAYVFWTKFSLCGIFLGWYIPYFISSIKHKKYKTIFNSIIFIICGLLIGTFPVIIYFVINQSITNLFNVYIIDNIFLYTVTNSETSTIIGKIFSLLKNLFLGLKNVKQFFPFLIYLLFFSSIYFIMRKWYKEILYTVSLIFFAFFFIYIGGRKYTYYSLGLAPFVSLCFIPFFLILSSENRYNKIFTHKAYSIYFILILFTFYFSNNKYMLFMNKNKLPQYKFAKVISNTKNATLLNYGKLDIGLYTTTGIVPNCKYFCILNIPLEEMHQKQLEYIEKGLCDYVTIVDDQYNKVPFSDADKNHLYTLVDKASNYYEGAYRTYFLYKLSTSKN